MNKFLLSLTLCFLLHLHKAHSEDAATDGQKGDSDIQGEELSRVKRGGMDMRRLGRGIQMLRLGKRGLPDDVVSVDDLLAALDSQYYDEEYPLFEEAPVHARYRRSADPSQETVPADSLFSNPQAQAADVKRSIDGLEDSLDDGYFVEPEDDEVMEKRPMNMLRLGKRPMNMLRLGKRPMNMLRLGKRPMNMLRLGKRPMNMLRLGKRPMNMLRLGKRFGEEGAIDEENLLEPFEEDGIETEKRPMNMLRLGKRPMNMLRLGKRPMNMLRLGKRPMNMLRLGKRPMNMLRLGKRPMNMLRLGKREAE